jgi:hypothetical protein
MPRDRRGDNTTALKESDIEEDYLDVDKPITGQNFYCVSFVSPDKILEQKDKFMFYHYEKALNKKISTMIDEGLVSLIDKSEDGNIDVSDVIALKKNVSKTCLLNNLKISLKILNVPTKRKLVKSLIKPIILKQVFVVLKCVVFMILNVRLMFAHQFFNVKTHYLMYLLVKWVIGVLGILTLKKLMILNI